MGFGEILQKGETWPKYIKILLQTRMLSSTELWDLRSLPVEVQNYCPWRSLPRTTGL